MNKRFLNAYHYYVLAIVTLLVSPGNLRSNGIDEFIKNHPKKADLLLSQITLSNASEDELDKSSALLAILNHYSNRKCPSITRNRLEWNDHTKKTADWALTNKFEIQGTIATQPSDSEGKIDWKHKGPHNDKEWSWLLNRHHYFRALVSGFYATENEAYREKISEHIIDWIDNNPVPKIMSFSAPWRALEAARRIEQSWIEAFEILCKDTHKYSYSILLLLSSIPEHIHYIQKYHTPFGNHVVTEMTASLIAASYFSEFKDAEHWQKNALSQLEEELLEQSYPDGSHKELSNHYQKLVLESFTKIYNLQARLGETRISTTFKDRLYLLWKFFLASTKPSGYGPINNDSDLENNLLYYQKNSPFKLDANIIKSSNHFPFAGQSFFRSDASSPDPHWSYMDTGPYGIAHQHDDRLHISLSIGKDDFLIDTGRYHYKKGKWRNYFKGEQSHNLICLRGSYPQIPPKEVNHSPLTSEYFSSENYDLISATKVFCKENPLSPKISAKHTRTLIYIRNKYWIVIDHINQFGNREIETLWHFHPNIIIQEERNRLLASSVEHKLSIQYLSTGRTEPFKILSAQEYPTIQGWCSNNYNQKQPSPTLSSIQKISGPTLNIWLFQPNPLSPYSDKQSIQIVSFGQSSEKIYEIAINATKTEKTYIHFDGNEHHISQTNNSKNENQCIAHKK